MQAFAFHRAERIEDALAAIARPGVKLLAGGTNLIDLMKGGIEQPAHVVDISRLPCASIESTEDGGVRIGALATNSAIAGHALIRRRYPLIARALLSGASPQLRNMASLGGNLMQRTRCWYFYDTAVAACNKRSPGSGCAARDGCNRMHAIFGASEHCVATHPSDLAVALCALDATVEVRSLRGERRIPIAAFHRLPGDAPQRDTTLEADELITAVALPPVGFERHSCYLKVRDRASYAFALVSVAAALDLDRGSVRDARIALGGVAHRPWRAAEAERILIGGALEADAIARAAGAALKDAAPLADNRFKVAMAERAIGEALRLAAGASEWIR